MKYTTKRDYISSVLERPVLSFILTPTPGTERFSVLFSVLNNWGGLGGVRVGCS